MLTELLFELAILQFVSLVEGVLDGIAGCSDRFGVGGSDEDSRIKSVRSKPVTQCSTNRAQPTWTDALWS